MAEQMNLFEDGGLEQDGGTVDPVSGNDVPMGSAQKEVRDDIPAQLSEGEFVFPADVVRFIGLERLMEIRQRAKAGLKKMEAMGQMGNSEEATIPDDIPFTIDDLEMEEEEEVSAYKGGTVKLENGGTPYVAPTIAEVPTATAPETIPTPEEFIPSVADEYREYVNDEGHVIDVPYFRGSILPGYNMPAGYRLKEDETVSTGQDITDTAMLDIVDKDRDATSPENMQKAREDMNRSYDNVVSQVMQDNPGASLEEITKKIKGGESTINIFGKKINAPGFLFNEDEITAAYDRAFSVEAEEPKRRGTLIATDKEGKVTDDVAPSSAKSLNMTESENKAIKEATESKNIIVPTSTAEGSTGEAEARKAFLKAESRRQEAEENRAKAQKEKTRVENVLKDRERGVTSRGFKQGGIASKPKKKKAMKRGGLASKK